MYNPVLGRFPSIDPKADEFAWVSPYNYAENEPIANIDLWGLQKLNYLRAKKIQGMNYSPISKNSWGSKGVGATIGKYKNYQNNLPKQYTDNPNGRCIDIMNNVLSNHYSLPREDFLDPDFTNKSDLTSRILVERVDYTAEKLGDMGLLADQKTIESNYHNEYVPFGEVESLNGDIASSMLQMTNNESGNFIFVVSAGSGYHTTMVAVETDKNGNTKYTFMDTGNVKEMSPNELQDYYLGKANIMESQNAEERYGVTTNLYLIKPSK